MAASTTPGLGFSFRWTLGESGWNTGMDINWRIAEMLLAAGVISADTIAQPGAPTDGDLYIVPPSATGTDWATQDGDLAYWDGTASGGADAWIFITPLEGMKFRAKDDERVWEYDGTVWGVLGRVSAATTITASTTQTQGQEPLLNNVNEVTVCANADDVVTAPALLAGMSLTIINSGANQLQVFPDTGDDIGAGVNTSVTVEVGATAKWECAADGVGVRIITEEALLKGSGASTITASTTQTQGQQPLVANVNEITVCANANDVVTMPLLLAGMGVTVVNNGAQTLQVFPASGDDIGAGVDTSVTLLTTVIGKWECAADGVGIQII